MVEIKGEEGYPKCIIFGGTEKMKHVIETFKSAFGGRFVLVMMGFVPAIYLFLVFFTGGIDAYKLFTFIIAPLIFCLFCFISAACTRSSNLS